MKKNYQSQPQTRFENDENAIGDSSLGPRNYSYGSTSYEHNPESFPMIRKEQIPCPKCGQVKHRFTSSQKSGNTFHRCLRCQHEWNVPASNKEISKEFGTVSSGGFNPTYNYTGSREIRNKIDKLISKSNDMQEISEEAHPHKPKSKLQKKILSDIRYLEKKSLENKINDVIKALAENLQAEQKIDKFIKGYERLILVPQFVDGKELSDLFQLSTEINILKGFTSPEISKEVTISNMIIGASETANNLYMINKSDGSELYERLFQLEKLTKCFSRLEEGKNLLMQQNKGRLDKISGMEKLEKGKLLEKSLSFWKLFERAIKEGVTKLDNKNLVLLREWLYAKV